jgi:GUN4-like
MNDKNIRMRKNLMPKSVYYSLSLVLFLVLFLFWHVNSLKVSYSELELLLSRKSWIEADLYTSKIVDQLLLKAVDNETFLGFSRLDFLNLKRTNILRSKGVSCQEVRKLDELWSKYSNGSFGLTAQAKIALSMKTCLPSLSGQPNFTWNISELKAKLRWSNSDSPYLAIPDWYAPANQPENAIGFLPSELWVLRNAGGGKPTYDYSDMLEHFIECKGLK